MAEEDHGRIAERLISRRTMLVGGAAAAGAVWVAPAIETIGTAASAASLRPGIPQGQGFSFVTVLVKSSDGTYYRFKFGNFPGPPANGSYVAVSVTDSGPKFQNGDCFKSTPDPTDPSGVTIVSDYPKDLTGQYWADASGRQRLQINNGSSTGFTLIAWAIHQGHCCASGTVPSITPTTYKGGPTGDLTKRGSSLVFLAPGNSATCA